MASTEAPGLRPGAPLEEGLDQQILAISTERQKFSRINTAYTEARVTGKHRRTEGGITLLENRQPRNDRELRLRASESPHRVVLKPSQKTSVAKRRRRTHHRRKPWLLSLELSERSPRSSSVSSLRLRPWELDGEALRVATKAGDRGEQRRLKTGREEAETRFKPVSFRAGTDPEPAQEKP
ncbi:hypothetical protein F2Q69_00050347 [Brassica cretica]|uniref:Uncharacterized protein n=1 Tax=Brassica cretica TaxID=69181 RepID=A0A8S9PMK8_BRACR|nr:hypothetical protein F2Q69_00050347 [Brassica cretica]